jgi:hypothetical protein
MKAGFSAYQRHIPGQDMTYPDVLLGIVAPKVASACHWTCRQPVAVARPDTNLIPPGTRYSATQRKAEK